MQQCRSPAARALRTRPPSWRPGRFFALKGVGAVFPFLSRASSSTAPRPVCSPQPWQNKGTPRRDSKSLLLPRLPLVPLVLLYFSLSSLLSALSSLLLSSPLGPSAVSWPRRDPRMSTDRSWLRRAESREQNLRASTNSTLLHVDLSGLRKRRATAMTVLAPKDSLLELSRGIEGTSYDR